MSRPVQKPRSRQRLYALVAILALVAALGVLGYLLIHMILELVVSLVLLAAAVVAAWTGLINRGPRRVVALTGAVLAAGVSVVLLGPSTLTGVLVVLALVVASAVAARAAVGRHRPAGGAAQPQPVTRPVGPATRAVMLVNPRSGAGQHTELIEAARFRGIDCVILGPDDDLRDVAEREAAAGAEALGMAGGDGSQAIVADVARRHDIGFVCVPAGTRNHFALDLGLDRHDPIAALTAFGAAAERRIDLATVNGRVFVNNASMGVYASIVQSDEYRGAKMSTAASMLPELIGPDSARFDLRFTGPDGDHHDTADLILVSNNPYAVATPVGIGSRPRLDSGELGIVTVGAQPTPRTGRMQVWTADAFEVVADGPVAVGIDGEAVMLQAPLRFASEPDALRLRVARTVVAPAAVGQAPGVRATVVALLRLVAGREPWPDR